MIKIQKDELEKAIHAFMKEMKVMLHAFDKDEEAETIEKIYKEKKEMMIEDTVHYLKEVEHIDVL